ncbi:MAG: adenylyl-sulfate kinase [Dermatophilaceae bacterium]
MTGETETNGHSLASEQSTSLATSGERLDEPRLQGADAVVADLRLLLRGVTLPWRDLGGSLGGPGPGAPAEMVHLRVSPAVADQVQAFGRLVITDRENSPVGRVTGATIEHRDGETWVKGLPEPSDRSETAQDGLGDADSVVRAGKDPLVVICQRPLLRAEVVALRSQTDAGVDLRIIVPDAGPTPDHMPHQVLRRCLERAVPHIPTASWPIAWRGHDSDHALARATATAMGASRLQLLDNEHPQWRELVADLHRSGDSPVRDVVSADTWAELTRWRPPRLRRGLVVFFTGLSGSGKSTLARMLVEHLEDVGDRNVSLLDGDEVRRLLSSDLGFDRASRELNIERIGFVASEIARGGGIAVCAPIAPYALSRAAVRERVAAVGDLVLVHLATPLAECERRDVKGLYARARAGLIKDFTGVSDPYETPSDADLTIDTGQHAPRTSLAVLLEYLCLGGWLSPQRTRDEGVGLTTMDPKERP